jgi:hypothetical protein
VTLARQAQKALRTERLVPMAAAEERKLRVPVDPDGRPQAAAIGVR